ncbi:hypothetical protein [Heyndrickxia camelliae]|nr:hypothetical protein [Heyndrickxia camelliae]
MPIELFSAAVRSVDDQMVSKNTFSLILYKNKTADAIYLDQLGHRKEILF